MCQPKQFSVRKKYNRRTDVLYILATIALFLLAMIVSTFWQQRQCDQSKTDLKIDCDQSKTDLKIDFTNELEYKVRFAKKAHRLYHDHIIDLITADHEQQLDDFHESCSSTDKELKAKLEHVEKESAKTKAKLEDVEKESAKTGKQEDELVIKSINHIMGLDRKLIATGSNYAMLLQICFYQQFALIVLICCLFYTWNDMRVDLAKWEHFYRNNYVTLKKTNRDLKSKRLSMNCTQCTETMQNALLLCKQVVARFDKLSELNDENVVNETYKTDK